MDNDAFRALVEQSKPKSTKQIAREAVEEEFKSNIRLKRAKAGGYSSSDEDSADDNRRRKTDKPDGNKFKKNKKRNGKEGIDTVHYRDRARERREGKNLDYNQTSNLLSAALALDDKDVSQYLGGDEHHTHLVRGLDVALAQKVKREMKKVDDNASKDKAGDNADAVFDQVTESFPIEPKKHAHINLEKNIYNPTSQLGQGMLSYLKAKYRKENSQKSALFLNASWMGVVQKPVASVAGKTIQQSTLTFSTDGNIHIMHKAWEMPKENTISRAEYEHLLGDDAGLTFTSLDHNFIEQLKTLLVGDEQVCKTLIFIIFL